jgi:flavin reductase (DIM6/NTAB) family NADH-FMN oxidoreductase RutF
MSAQAPTFTDRDFKQALGRFPTGVTIVSTYDVQGQPAGLTVSSFNSVSLQPPLVVWSLKQTSQSLAVFQQCERYVIQVLAADQLPLAAQFASGTNAERFAGHALRHCPSGTPRLAAGCAAWFECYNRHRFAEGDHVVLIGQVEHCGYSERAPLVYHAGGYDLTPNVLETP